MPALCGLTCSFQKTIYANWMRFRIRVLRTRSGWSFNWTRPKTRAQKFCIRNGTPTTVLGKTFVEIAGHAETELTLANGARSKVIAF